MRHNRQSSALDQFLVGLAIATVAGSVIAPLGTKTLDPVTAVLGIAAAMALVFIAIYRQR